MGLDVYVGSLTRYYAGDWETIIQQAAREQGLEFQVIRADEPENAVTDPEEIQAAVLGWRSALGSALGCELDWEESQDTPYYTDKPDWEGYGGLQLLAAYAERGKDKQPKTSAAEWHRDKEWRKANKQSSPRYRHLYAPELWFPTGIAEPVTTTDASGNELTIGSSSTLLSHLRDLNEQTFKGSDEEQESWRREGVEPEGEFDDAARFGLAVFLELAEKSVTDRLPMKLDY